MLESGGAGAEWSSSNLGPDPGVCMRVFNRVNTCPLPSTLTLVTLPQGINNFNRRLPNKHLFKQASGGEGPGPGWGQAQVSQACAELQRSHRMKMTCFLSLKCIA